MSIIDIIYISVSWRDFLRNFYSPCSKEQQVALYINGGRNVNTTLWQVNCCYTIRLASSDSRLFFIKLNWKPINAAIIGLLLFEKFFQN